MTLGKRIEDQFAQHARVLEASSEALLSPLSEAVERMVAALSEDHKILACGNAPSHSECQRLVNVLQGGFERARTALPALCLSAVRGEERPQDPEAGVAPFARQVEGLARPGDVLVAMSALGNCANVVDAVVAAHERGLSVIAITGRAGGLLAEALTGDDIHLAVPADRPVLINALQRIVVNCLCDGIDWNFLGDEA